MRTEERMGVRSWIRQRSRARKRRDSQDSVQAPVFEQLEPRLLLSADPLALGLPEVSHGGDPHAGDELVQRRGRHLYGVRW